jgi:hypothetical protein
MYTEVRGSTNVLQLGSFRFIAINQEYRVPMFSLSLD